MDTLLQHLLPVWHAHTRAEALKHSPEVVAGGRSGRRWLFADAS